MSVGYRAFMSDTSVSDSTRDVEDARAIKAAKEWARGRELADARFASALAEAGYAGWCHDLAARDSQWSYPQVEIIDFPQVEIIDSTSRSPKSAERASWAFVARFEIEDAQAAAAKAAAKAEEKASKEAAEMAALSPFAVLSALKVRP